MCGDKVSIALDIGQDTWIGFTQPIVTQEMRGSFAHRGRVIAFAVIVEVPFTEQARALWIKRQRRFPMIVLPSAAMEAVNGWKQTFRLRRSQRQIDTSPGLVDQTVVTQASPPPVQ